MNKYPHPHKSVVLIIGLYSVLAFVAWIAVQHHAKAQTYCPVPKSFSEAGDPARPRWAPFQRVHVILYPNHFTASDKTAIQDILSEFETAGRTSNCSNVSFIDIREESFPIPAGVTAGNPAAVDTLYIFRRPVNQMPDAAGQEGGRGTPDAGFSRYTNANIALREDVTTTTAFSTALFGSD